MAFIETPRFPEEVSPWLVGGEEFKTDIVQTQGGNEYRNQIWSVPLRRYQLSNALRTFANAIATKSYFRSVGGRANGFRVKDVFDYSVDVTTGAIGSASIGTGAPTYQLYKKYVSGSTTSLGPILKPVVGTFVPYRNGAVGTLGSGAGQWAIDTTTGIATIVADSTSAASSITANTTTQVVLAGNLGLTAGKFLYLNGFTGNDSASVNGIAHTINSVTGNGPYTFTLATNTAGKTLTLGTGSGYKYPQATDTLTWTGEFDIPVRFDMDWLQVGMDTGLSLWDNITLIELRTP